MTECRRAPGPPVLPYPGASGTSRLIRVLFSGSAARPRVCFAVVPGRGLLLRDRHAIPQRDGHPDDFAVRWKHFAGSFLESLHGVHELELIVGVLFLERGGIDPLPSFLAGSPFRSNPFGVPRRSGGCPWSDCGRPSLSAVAALMEQGVRGKRGKIEFGSSRFRLIIILGHGLRSRNKRRAVAAPTAWAIHFRHDNRLLPPPFCRFGFERSRDPSNDL